MRQSLVEFGQWPHQLTWHIIAKSEKIPICGFKDLAPIAPLCQPITMINELIGVCKTCNDLYTLGDDNMTLYDTVYLLSELTKHIPPGENQRHNITLHNGVLEITFMLGDKYIPVVLSNDDLYMRLDKLIRNLIEVVNARQSF